MRFQGGFGLAFLDLLSCALGGVILLFLIFSTFDHLGDQRSRSDEGLVDRALILALPTDTTGDPAPLPRLLRLSLNGPASISRIAAQGLDGDRSPTSWTVAPDGQWTHRFLIFVPEFSRTGLRVTLPQIGRATVLQIEALAGMDSGWRRHCRVVGVTRQLVLNFTSNGNLDAGPLNCQEPEKPSA